MICTISTPRSLIAYYDKLRILDNASLMYPLSHLFPLNNALTWYRKLLRLIGQVKLTVMPRMCNLIDLKINGEMIT